MSVSTTSPAENVPPHAASRRLTSVFASGAAKIAGVVSAAALAVGLASGATPATAAVRPFTNSYFYHFSAWSPGGLTLYSSTVKFVYQGDGNLVVYCRSSGKAVWASNTDGANGNATLHFQNDGNLVIYNYGVAIWASNTDGNPGDWGTVQDDGNVVIYRSAGNAAWSTGTNGRC